MNHGYNRPEEGTQDWHVPLNDNFAKLDRDVQIRDDESQLDSYEPTDGSMFVAVDTGRVFLGDGTRWNYLDSIGGNDTVAITSDGTTVRAVQAGTVLSEGSDFATVAQAAFDTGSDVRITEPTDESAYELTSGLVVRNSHQRIVVEHCVTIEAAYGSGVEAMLRTDPNQYIKHVHIVGGRWNGATEATFGIDLGPSRNCVIDSVDVNFVGCGIRIHDDPDVQGAYWNSIRAPIIQVSGNAPEPPNTGRHAGILLEDFGGLQPNANNIYGGWIGAGGVGGAALHIYGTNFSTTVHGTELSSETGHADQIACLTEQAESGKVCQNLQLYGCRIEMIEGTNARGLINKSTSGAEAGRFVCFMSDLTNVDTRDNYSADNNIYHYLLWDPDTPECVINTNVRIADASYTSAYVNGVQQ